MALIVTKLSNNIIRSYDTLTRYGINIEPLNWSAVLTPASLTINAFGKVVGVIYTDQALNQGNSIFSYTVPSDVPASAYAGQSGSGAGLDTESVDDRINSLIITQGGLTKAYDDVNNTLTLTSGTKILDNISTSLALEPIASGSVSCSKYWPGTVDVGAGGLFRGLPATGNVIDNVKVFAAADGVWVRVSDGNYLAHAGAVGKKNNNTFRSFQTPLRNYLPNVLLSDKFATLAAARAWYPFANVLSLTESLNSAALQHLACLGEVNIEDASYWFNRAFEYFSGVAIKGKGSGKSILIFDADNAFKPRFESTTQPGFAEIYKQNMYFGGIACYGTIPVNATGQLLITENTPFVESSSGFYLPRKAPLPNTDDGTSTNPQMLFTRFEDLLLERFAGHGISLGNVFNAQLEKVRGENNKGFGTHHFQANSVICVDCYVGRFNTKGGFWLENGGKLDNCNGPDSFDQRPGVVFGAPGSSQKIIAEVNGGNIEGTSRLIDLHGDGSSLKIVNTFLQYHHTDSNYPPIRVHGINCTIDIDVSAVGPSGSSTIPTTKPNNLMWVRGSGNGHNVIVRNMPPFSGSDYYTYMVVNAADTNLYGSFGEILYLKPDEARVGQLDYGTALDIHSKTSQFPKLYVKDQAIGTVDTTAALPTITANPGLYVNVNAAATAANKLFIKVGDTNTGWNALSVVSTLIPFTTTPSVSESPPGTFTGITNGWVNNGRSNTALFTGAKTYQFKITNGNAIMWIDATGDLTDYTTGDYGLSWQTGVNFGNFTNGTFAGGGLVNTSAGPMLMRIVRDSSNILIGSVSTDNGSTWLIVKNWGTVTGNFFLKFASNVGVISDITCV